jgi:S-adenosylmethionine hydrolase
MRNCIALLTDFGLRDPYVGLMKAVIQSKATEANLIDITHGINAQNIEHARFILRKSLPFFPDDTTFLCVVDPGVGTDRLPIAIQTEKHNFIGPDNGLFTDIYELYQEIEVRSITNEKIILEDASSTFHGRDIFAPAAAFIAWGGEFKRIGEQIETQNLRKSQDNVVITEDIIAGKIIFSDHFGNLVSNIELEDLNFLKGDKLIIECKNHTLNKLHQTFSDVAQGELLAYVSSFNTLAIGANRANASEILSTISGEEIIVKTS